MPDLKEPAVQYVDQTPQGNWRIAGTRIPIDTIIYAYREGQTPEQIVAEYFPSLSLEQVHGAIAFYLRHRPLLDRHLADNEARFDELRNASREANRDLRERIMTRWQKLQIEKQA